MNSRHITRDKQTIGEENKERHSNIQEETPLINGGNNKTNFILKHY